VEYRLEVERRPDAHGRPGRITVTHRAGHGLDRVARSQRCNGGIRGGARWSRQTDRSADPGDEGRGGVEASPRRAGDDLVCGVGSEALTRLSSDYAFIMTARTLAGCTLVAMLIASAVHAQQGTEILLWPNGAPGSEGKTAKERVRIADGGDHVISSIHR